MKSSRNLQGFSLPELMIAMLLGLVIAGAAISMLSSASAAAKEQRVQAELSQEAYSALAFMALHLRMAGYREVPGMTETNLFGCGASFENSKVKTIDDLHCESGNSGVGSSAFAVRYEVDQYNAELDATGTPADCTGRAINSGEAVAIGAEAIAATPMQSRFFVQTSTTTKNPALYCAGNGSAAGADPSFVAQSMADNVEAMRVSYGLDAGAHKSASEIDAQPESRARKWNRVREVRLCLQMRSASGVTALRTAYLDCDGKLIVPPVGDTRLHRTFAQTVQLRNAIR